MFGGIPLTYAFVKVQNDILKAIDNNRSVILLLLKLSAAFDTVDHSILLSRLQNRFGIRNIALKWFHSYLHSREQFVSVNGIESSKKHLSYGVPQGSVLGPLLYSLYTSPLGDIARKHSIPFHLYADDTQLYLSFTSNCPNHLPSTKIAVELCVKDIGDWMLRNKLKLNQDKTELLVISSKYRPRPPLDYIRVGEEVIMSSKQARNLGVGFDQYLDFKEHVKITCKSAFFRIRSIAKIRRYLSQSTTEAIVDAYITSRLDYCNALPYGLPKYLINRFPLLQNSAARLVTLTRRQEHITPILRSLDWLPVHYRIVFEILLLTYKALNGLAPDYIKDLLKYNDSRRTLRSSNNRLLDEPRANLKTFGERAFSVAAPRLWNKLPLQIKSGFHQQRQF